MIYKFNKRALFKVSAILSTFLGVFGYAKVTNQEISDVVLDNPLISIERTYASDGGGGDCCGSSTNDTYSWPTPTSSGVVITSVQIQ